MNRKRMGDMFFATLQKQEETELFVYSDISQNAGTCWDKAEGEETTPERFVEELRHATDKSRSIVVRINSGGGAVTAAQAIATHLKECRDKGKRVVCKIDGICASAAVQIALACGKVFIPAGGYMMIDDPALFLWDLYDAKALRKHAQTLDTIKEGILEEYREKTGMDRQELARLMEAETWMTGKRAVELGFADQLMFTEEAQNAARPAGAGLTPKKFGNGKEKGEQFMEIKNVEELSKQYPQLAQELTAQARAQERQRLKDLDALADQVDPDFLQKAKYEQEKTAEAAALEALKMGALWGPALLRDMQEDALPAAAVTAAVTQPAPAPEEPDDARLAQALAKQIFEGRKKS